MNDKKKWNIIGRSLENSEYRQEIIWYGIKTIMLSLYLSAAAACLWGGYLIVKDKEKIKERVEQCLKSLKSCVKESVQELEERFERR